MCLHLTTKFQNVVADFMVKVSSNQIVHTMRMVLFVLEHMQAPAIMLECTTSHVLIASALDRKTAFHPLTTVLTAIAVVCVLFLFFLLCTSSPNKQLTVTFGSSVLSSHYNVASGGGDSSLCTRHRMQVKGIKTIPMSPRTNKLAAGHPNKDCCRVKTPIQNDKEARGQINSDNESYGVGISNRAVTT